MDPDFFHQGQLAFQRLLDEYPIDDEMLKKIASGCMCGTALASPILFELRNIWALVVLVFFISAAAFMLQNQQEIKTFGPFTLVAATFLGLAAYSSARTPLQELVPWLPTTTCLFLLLTVYFFPKLKQVLQRENGTQMTMEEGRWFGHPGTPAESGSNHPQQDLRSRHQSPYFNWWLAYNTAHVGGAGQTAPEAPSIHDSDIDLEDRHSTARIVAQRMISPSRPGYNLSNMPQTASDGGVPSQRFAAAGSSSQLRDYRPQSLSPESLAVEVSSSTTAESDRLLLG